MKKGFSILELLVVVAIINIIAALLFSAMRSSNEKTRYAMCINNQRNLTGSLIMYAMDNGSFPNNLVAWLTQEGTPYYDQDPSSFWDLQDKTYASTMSAQAYFDGMFSKFKCPESKYSNKYKGVDYGMNQILENKTYGSISNPDQMIIITDAHTSYSIASSNDIDFRHHKKAMACFVDGHAELIESHNLYPYDDGGVGYTTDDVDIDTDYNGIPDIQEYVALTFNFAQTMISSNGFTWTFLGFTDNGDGTGSFTFSLINANGKSLSAVAFELPGTSTALIGTTYTTSIATYLVDNGVKAHGAQNAFNSVKFKTTAGGIKSGQSDIFAFTVPNTTTSQMQNMKVYAKASSTEGQGQYTGQ